jgi:hypothetical protein
VFFRYVYKYKICSWIIYVISQFKVLAKFWGVYYLYFLCCGKIAKNPLKGENIYFGSWFQRFQFMVTWLHCFWVFGETEYHDKEYVVKRICSPHGTMRIRERETEKKRCPWQKKKKPTKTCCSDLLLPTRLHFLEILPPSNSPLGMN